MPYYRTKPITIEAHQYTRDNFLELQDWNDDHVALSDYNDDAICVYTLEGPCGSTKATTSSKASTASRMCPNDEKFTRVIEVQE